MVKKAVIVAAGRGIRLEELTDEIPKPLVAITENAKIIDFIFEGLKESGIYEVGVVIGYEGGKIKEYLTKRYSKTFSLSFVKNDEWTLGNGYSLYKAKDIVNEGENFLLLMSDHIISYKILDIVSSAKYHYCLGVDKRIDEVFDIDDATKVLLGENNKISAIGKELINYNAVDIGVFKLNYDIFHIAEGVLNSGADSISNIMNELIKQSLFYGVPIGNDSFWIDLDTKESINYFIRRRKNA